ncbi:hypothetical protein FACS1894202_12210 [Clostridia bacterium]|nr:hypothetical protein FACS1894202_12210 [Clostridia bacterium]
MDDAKIIDLYRARSESAISETARKYGRYCKKIAMNILRNTEDADEAVNDAYLKVWNAIPPQCPTVFRAFLGKITRNLSLNRYKAGNARKRGGDEVTLLLTELEDCIPSVGGVEAAYEANALAEAIDGFLRSESADSRRVFVRRYWYADPITAIASRFQMSESKVKSMLFRTRNKLKIHLEKEGVTI